jgi:hypothetical protein
MTNGPNTQPAIAPTAGSLPSSPTPATSFRRQQRQSMSSSDRQAGVTERMSVDAGNQSDGSNREPAMSADGAS